MFIRYIFSLTICLCSTCLLLHSQSPLRGQVLDVAQQGIPGAHITVMQADQTLGNAVSDSLGSFVVDALAGGTYLVQVSVLGYVDQEQVLTHPSSAVLFVLRERITRLDEVVVTGTSQQQNLKDALVPIQVYSSAYLERQASPTLFEDLTHVTGISTQLDCSVCYTSSVSIGGVDSHHTQYLVDNMPVVSSLATTYVLSSLSSSLIDRVEILRGAGSTRYGAEAIGGTIQLVTKDPFKTPKLDVMYRGNSYFEQQASVLGSFRRKKHAFVSVVNYFDSRNQWDRNSDGFNDIANQKRFSVLGTYSARRPYNRQLTFTVRGMYEDRLAGALDWKPIHRGTDEVYGESIYTNQWFALGRYQLPTRAPLFLYGSYTFHDQNSAYGDGFFIAQQHTVFGQFFWEEKEEETHKALNWTAGLDMRAIFYDDNTAVTAGANPLVEANQPLNNILWGAFVEPRWELGTHVLSPGLRVAYHQVHGAILSPRFAYNWQLDPFQTIKASLAHGFKVADFFSESHAGISGGRELVVQDNLAPEQSYALYLNYLRQQTLGEHFMDIDLYAGAALFDQAFQFDYDRSDNQVFYENLDEYSWNVQGGIGTSWFFSNSMQLDVGVAYTVNRFRLNEGDGTWEQPFKVSPWQVQASWQTPVVWGIEASWTAQLRSPMRLPILTGDVRPEYSPWYSLQDVRLAKSFKSGVRLQLGVKNLLDVMPNDPLLRAFDPFDKQAGDTASNPHGHTFDTAYGYLPLQGRRVYLGLSFRIN